MDGGKGCRRRAKREARPERVNFQGGARGASPRPICCSHRPAGSAGRTEPLRTLFNLPAGRAALALALERRCAAERG
jgi:hypothetical protein